MDVSDLLWQFMSTENIAVIATTGQPESRGTLAVGNTPEYRGIQLTPTGDDLHGKALLEFSQQFGHGVVRELGQEQEVYMLGHHHPGDELETEPLSSHRKVLAESVLDPVISKEGQATIAGKGEVAGLVGDLVSTEQLAVDDVIR